MRFNILIHAVAVIAMAASSASALDIALTQVGAAGCDLATPTAGCSLELDLNIANPDMDNIQSLGISVTARDFDGNLIDVNDVLSITSSATTGNILLNTTTFIGLTGAVNPFVSPADDGINVIRAIQLASVAGANGPGEGDPIPRPGGNGGEVQLVLALSGLPAGLTGYTLQADLVQGDSAVGTGGAVSTVFTTDPIEVGVVPEPGTALLMGLGLAGLAGVGRRK